MPSNHWVEVSCSLFPGLDGRAHLPWTAIADASRSWREEGLFDLFWFVRKMPGLKLRWRSQGVGGELESRLATWLHEAERRNDVRGYRWTRYEPEKRRFGGSAGMAIAHRHFDAGTRAVLDHGVALAAGRQRLDPLTWSIANTSDLLKRALGDSAEIWDVWMQLRESASGSAISCEGAVPVNLATATAAGGWERLVEVLGDEDMAAANVAASTNEHAAESLRAVAESGRLEVGTRAWLSAVTVFEWNRWGLPTNLEALREALSWVSDHCRPDLPCQQLHSSATRASATGRQSMQRDDIDRAES